MRMAQLDTARSIKASKGNHLSNLALHNFRSRDTNNILLKYQLAPRGPRFDRAPRGEGEPTPRSHGTRGARGARGGRGGARHGGFDRHSGTGIVDSEKKEHNRLGDATTAPLEGEKDAQEIARESAAPSPEPAEPEVAVKTLDDYLQEKAAKSLKLSLPETRAANAGADDSKWKDAKVLEVEEATDFIKMGKDSVAKSRKGKKEGKVLITDIDLRFTEPARDPAPRGAFRGGRGGGDRGGRGGRGGARGGRGGNSNHPPSGPRRSGGASVNVDDTELFPSLGSQ
ncbi:hypothetical protein BG015_008813 [Linnemannia schmuckeri]|uniref:Hyaluronan/mRNA-binding protein domain-containing protein n=1 Tax=Linnemannia schmuckeri TaxID=64567 RepID=A0A9P5VAA0_9FUNG|nr:hypothetical protein BG015_008813 [Linnemannia schmuckeri]